MVYYTQNSERKVTIAQSAIAGGIASSVTRAIAQPLDVLKIRFQLQLEPIQNGSKYSSLLQAISSIAREEGVSTLWSGHIPAQFLSISFGVVQFSTYERLTQTFQRNEPQFYINNKNYLNFCNGAVAATFATILSYPFDTIRTRLVAEQKINKVYKGFSDSLLTMIRHEGASSLFKGIVPTIAQIAPYAGIQFYMYKLLTESIFNRLSLFQRKKAIGSVIETTIIGNVIAGSIAGLVSKTCVYPFDVIKKRLQIQGFQQHRKAFGRQMYCSGSLQCIMLTINEEGVLALYKGYGPSLVKAIVVTALHFTVYDEIKHVILQMHE
ncbi:unnamed protein product [Pieris brassicae]|uniref:Mitochondrial carrier protein n=1 Tax=Pieris brassicae TaxID=7116 RepID=A0A9P0XBM9_PIEBR|nr:unnamed protein product [Pieris brassicae]